MPKSKTPMTLESLMAQHEEARPISNGEFLKAFAQVVKYVKGNGETLLKNHAELSQNLTDKISEHLNNIHTNNQANFEDIKGQIQDALQKHTDTINAKLASIQDGEDGEDGKDAEPIDLDVVAQKAAALIPAPKDVDIDEDKLVEAVISKLPAPKVDKSGKQVPGWGAHPLVIQDATTVKTKVARRIKFTGATVSQSADGTTTVAISSSGLSPIAVTGTINDSNVTFTAASTPTLLIINGAMYTQTGGAITWSIAGTTITLSSPVGSGGSILGI